MGIGDFLGWILIGLLAGGLASALTPGRTPGGLLGVIGLGVLGALLGGWGWALLFGSGPTTFLGSVIVGVLGAMALLYLLRRLERTRYRIWLNGTRTLHVLNLRRQQGANGRRDAGREKRHMVVGAEPPTRVDQVESGRVLRVLSRLSGWPHVDAIGRPDAREHGTWGGEIVPVHALPAGERGKVARRSWCVPLRCDTNGVDGQARCGPSQIVTDLAEPLPHEGALLRADRADKGERHHLAPQTAEGDRPALLVA